jgi:hypothetical protein
MDNPDDEKTTINVKAVSARAWERAKSSAIKQGETMGAWLSRAINQLADAEAGPREFPPVKPAANLPAETGNPGPAAAPEAIAHAFGALLSGQAALVAATGIQPLKREVRLAHALVDALSRDMQGIDRLPPPKPRQSRSRGGKAAGQSLLGNGKAAPLLDGPVDPGK